MKKLSAYLEIIRVPNSIMMGVAVLVGILISDPGYLLHGDSLLRVAFGFLTGFFLTASSMVLNDYVDREIDAINEPERPIPSGKIRPNKAFIYGIALGILGLFFSVWTGICTFILASLTFLIAILYNFRLKKFGLLGNMCVAYTVSVPLLYGSLLSNSLSEKILLYSAMIFLSIVGREITKGISDIEGDSRKGVKTLAVRYGEKKASYAALSFFLAAVLLSFIPPMTGMANLWYTALVSITDALLVLLSLQLVREPTRRNAKKVKNRVLVAMAIGLAAFALSSV